MRTTPTQDPPEGSGPVTSLSDFERTFSVLDRTGLDLSVVRDDRTIVFLSSRLKAMCGDLVGRMCYETALASDDVCRGCPVAAKEAGSDFPYVRIATSKDGVLLRLTVDRLEDPGTGRAYFICAQQDISLERERDTHVRRLTSAMEHMAEAVAVLDAEGKVVYVNKAFLDVTGLDPTRISGLRFDGMASSRYSPSDMQRIMQEAMTRGWKGEIASSAKDSEKHFLSIEATPIKDEEGRPLGIVSTFRDVTRSKIEKAESDRYRSQLEEKMEARTNELAKRVSQLTTINKIGRVATSILDPDELMAEFTKSIATGFGYSQVTILVMDKEHGELYHKAGYGPRFDGTGAGHPVRLKDGIIGHAAYFSETLVTGDVRSDPRYTGTSMAGTQSEMAVPISFRGELLGVLDIQSEQRDAFTRSDVTLLEMLADILATAITTARTFTEAKEREQALSVLDRISKQISFRLEPLVILEQVARDASSLLRAEKSLVGLKDDDGASLRWVASYNVNKSLLTGKAYTCDKGVSGRALRRLKTEVVNDYDSDPDCVKADMSIFEIRSMMSAPLTVEGQGRGIVNVYNKLDGKKFSKSDALLLSSLADHVAIALENANLLSSLNQRVRTQLLLLESALSMQRQIDSSSIYELVADRLRDVVHYDAITIYRVDHDRGVMVPQLARGSYIDEVMEDRFPIGEGITGYVAKTGVAEMVNEAISDHRAVVISGTPQEKEALMAIPLKGKEKVIGVLTMYRDGGRSFTPNDFEVAQLFSSQAAVAVENFELYKMEESLLADTRTKIAQMSRILELTSSVMFMDDLDSLLQRTAESAVASFGFRRCHLALLDEAKAVFDVRAFTGYPDWVEPGRSVPLSRVLMDLEEEFKIGKAVYYVPFEKQKYGIEAFDFLAHPENATVPRQSPTSWHERDILVVALRDRSGRLIGYMQVDEPDDMRVPGKDHLETLEILGGIASIGIENTRLFDRQVDAVNEIALLNDLMTHDINNFNQGIMGYLELLLQDRRLDVKQRKYAEMALVQVRNNARLIDNIRKLSKVRAMSDKGLTVVDLHQPITRAVEAVTKMNSDREVVIVSLVSPGIHYAMGNDYIGDLFMNLIQNAVKFDTAKRVKVDLSISEDRTAKGDYWVVSITDRGRGIPDDRKRAVFERFATGMTGIKGFGLGLSIVSTVVEKYGGRIWVEDRVKDDFTKGAVFKMTFPKAKPPENHTTGEAVPAEAATSSSSSTR